MTSLTASSRFRRHGDVGLVALAFAIAWLCSFNLATILVHAQPGFVHWSDQDRYLQSARALMRGDLRPDQHWYPLLYPIILAPFSGLPPLYETLIPDFACYALTYLGFRHVARGFGVGSFCTALIFLPATIAWPHTGDSWLQPWTSTPSAALIWASLALAGDVLRKAPAATRPFRMISCGLLLGLIPVCRPGDSVVCGVIGLFLLITLLHRKDFAALARVVIAASLPLTAGVSLHLAIYGAEPSDYMRLSATYGEQFERIGWKAYLILIEPRPWFPDCHGLFMMLPWIPFGLCGFVLAAMKQRDRAVVSMIALAVVVYCSIALCYMDLIPSGLWKFGNVHYFKWVFPAIALVLWIMIRDGRDQPRLTLAVVVAMLTLTAVRIEPVQTGSLSPARLVVFHGPKVPYANIYNAHSTLSDRHGVMRNIFDFHLVPTSQAGTVYGEALRRDFYGDERWVHPGDISLWPRMQTTHYTTTPLPGRFPIAATARYRPVIGFGLPCWLPPYPCPADLPDVKDH